MNLSLFLAGCAVWGCLTAMLSSPGVAAVPVSGSDDQVRRTTIAADRSGRHVVVFWESKEFNSREHIRFNRSITGGKRWRREPLAFPYNDTSRSDYLPEIGFDLAGALHLLWSQQNDTESPCTIRSSDLGATWTKKIPIGGGHQPRQLGVTLTVSDDGSDLWAFYHDSTRRAYACGSTDAGQSWTVLADHDGEHSPGNPEGYCSDAAAHAGRRYVLRQRSGQLNVLVNDGESWSQCLPTATTGPVTLAADHTITVDSQGRVFIVFGDAGRVYCLRSDDQGASFGAKVAVTTGSEGAAGSEGEQSLPVIALLPDDQVVVAWQQSVGETSAIRYAMSTDGGQTFRESRVVSSGAGLQTAPDVCAVGETLFFSFTEQGRAFVARVPELPPVVGPTNLLPDPGFDDFDGSAPREWTVYSWNQEFLQERFGKGTPGRGDTGSCLEMEEGSGASIIRLTAPPIAIDGDTTYFFKGYYASACQKVAVKGEWLHENGETLSSFEILLPDTQDEWIHFLKELSSPLFAQQLRFAIEKKWQSRRVRFDDFSLRQGTVADYADEFDLPDPSSAEPWFPVFSIMGGSVHGHDQELDYVLANFNVGGHPRFGLRYSANVPADTETLLAMDRDPAVWLYWAFDEPGEVNFPALSQLRQELRGKGVTKPMWCNLLPNYGLKSNEAYEQYVRNYLDMVKPTFFTYDHYALHVGNKSYGQDFYANLVIVDRQAQAHSVDWGVILLVVAHGGLRSPDEAELRWQAYSALAYGAKAIGWFTYGTEVEYAGLNWRDAVVDREGHRTRHYSMLKRVNGEIQQVGKTLIGLQSTGAYHTEPLPKLTTSIGESNLIQSIEGGRFIIGEFLDRPKDHPKNHHGRRYFMVVNRDFNAPATASIVLAHPTGTVREISKTTTAVPVVVEEYDARARSLTVPLAPGDGRLFLLE